MSERLAKNVSAICFLRNSITIMVSQIRLGEFEIQLATSGCHHRSTPKHPNQERLEFPARKRRKKRALTAFYGDLEPLLESRLELARPEHGI